MTEQPLQMEVGTESSSGEPSSGERSSGQPSSGERGRFAVTRRELLAGLAGLVAGIGGTWLLRDPASPGPLTTTRLDVGAVANLERRIAADGHVLVEGDQPIAVVAWNPALPFLDGTAADVYGPGGEGHPMTSTTTGLMVLVLQSTHLGCRVLRCASSGWYEDPCHGSMWNRWGEYVLGPAPRGLDRLGSTVENGRLVLRLSATGLIPGPPRELQVLQEPASGPNCIDY